jgi:SAM-dependent methyltransferase
MFRPLIDRARRTARLAVGRALRFGTAPPRVVATAVIWLLPGLERRFAGLSWLWQPGWGRARHERLYRRPDPYGLASSSYEQAKLDLVVDVLDQLGAAKGTGRVLEVGCGEGLLTARLAEYAAELVAVDISDTAVTRARTALADHGNVLVERRTLPLDMPEGSFDLIVCSDVLYFWEPRTLRRGLDRLLEGLRPGGRLLLLHYRGVFGQAGRGDAVHDAARARALRDPALRHELAHTMRHVGPGGAGIRLDVVARVPTARLITGTVRLPQQLRRTSAESRLRAVEA